MKADLKCKCGAHAVFEDGEREHNANSLADEWLRVHSQCYVKQIEPKDIPERSAEG